MTEATGGRRYYNFQTGAGRCGNIVQPAKYIKFNKNEQQEDTKTNAELQTIRTKMTWNTFEETIR